MADSLHGIGFSYLGALPKLLDLNEIAAAVFGYQAASVNNGFVFVVIVYILDSIDDVRLRYDVRSVSVFCTDAFPQPIINWRVNALHKTWSPHSGQVNHCLQVYIYQLCCPAYGKRGFRSTYGECRFPMPVIELLSLYFLPDQYGVIFRGTNKRVNSIAGLDRTS